MCLLHLHVRIQEFSPSGGGGVEGPGPPDSKKLGHRFLLFLLFLVLTFNYLTVLQRGPIPRSHGLFFGKQ